MSTNSEEDREATSADLSESLQDSADIEEEEEYQRLQDIDRNLNNQSNSLVSLRESMKADQDDLKNIQSMFTKLSSPSISSGAAIRPASESSESNVDLVESSASSPVKSFRISDVSDDVNEIEIIADNDENSGNNCSSNNDKIDNRGELDIDDAGTTSMNSNLVFKANTDINVVSNNSSNTNEPSSKPSRVAFGAGNTSSSTSSSSFSSSSSSKNTESGGSSASSATSAVGKAKSKYALALESQKNSASEKVTAQRTTTLKAFGIATDASAPEGGGLVRQKIGQWEGLVMQKAASRSMLDIILKRAKMQALKNRDIRKAKGLTREEIRLSEIKNPQTGASSAGATQKAVIAVESVSFANNPFLQKQGLKRRESIVPSQAAPAGPSSFNSVNSEECPEVYTVGSVAMYQLSDLTAKTQSSVQPVVESKAKELLTGLSLPVGVVILGQSDEKKGKQDAKGISVVAMLLQGDDNEILMAITVEVPPALSDVLIKVAVFAKESDEEPAFARIYKMQSLAERRATLASSAASEVPAVAATSSSSSDSTEPPSSSTTIVTATDDGADAATTDTTIVDSGSTNINDFAGEPDLVTNSNPSVSSDSPEGSSSEVVSSTTDIATDAADMNSIHTPSVPVSTNALSSSDTSPDASSSQEESPSRVHTTFLNAIPNPEVENLSSEEVLRGEMSVAEAKAKLLAEQARQGNGDDVGKHTPSKAKTGRREGALINGDDYCDDGDDGDESHDDIGTPLNISDSSRHDENDNSNENNDDNNKNPDCDNHSNSNVFSNDINSTAEEGAFSTTDNIPETIASDAASLTLLNAVPNPEVEGEDLSSEDVLKGDFAAADDKSRLRDRDDANNRDVSDSTSSIISEVDDNPFNSPRTPNKDSKFEMRENDNDNGNETDASPISGMMATWKQVNSPEYVAADGSHSNESQNDEKDVNFISSVDNINEEESSSSIAGIKRDNDDNDDADNSNGSSNDSKRGDDFDCTRMSSLPVDDDAFDEDDNLVDNSSFNGIRFINLTQGQDQDVVGANALASSSSSSGAIPNSTNSMFFQDATSDGNDQEEWQSGVVGAEDEEEDDELDMIGSQGSIDSPALFNSALSNEKDNGGEKKEEKEWTLADERDFELPSAAQFRHSIDISGVGAITCSASCVILQLKESSRNASDEDDAPEKVASGTSKQKRGVILISGTLKMAEITDRRSVICRDFIFEWSRGVAVSGWMRKWPLKSEKSFVGRAKPQFCILRNDELTFYSQVPRNENEMIEFSESTPDCFRLNNDTKVLVGRKMLRKCISVDNQRDTLWARVPISKHNRHTEALWVAALKNAVRQCNRRVFFASKMRVESKWFHESDAFECVAVDSYVSSVQGDGQYVHLALFKLTLAPKAAEKTMDEAKNRRQLWLGGAVALGAKLSDQVADTSVDHLSSVDRGEFDSNAFANISYSLDIGTSEGTKIQLEVVNKNFSLNMQSNISVVKLFENSNFMVIGGSNGYLGIGLIGLARNASGPDKSPGTVPLLRPVLHVNRISPLEKRQSIFTYTHSSRANITSITTCSVPIKTEIKGSGSSEGQRIDKAYYLIAGDDEGFLSLWKISIAAKSIPSTVAAASENSQSGLEVSSFVDEHPVVSLVDFVSVNCFDRNRPGDRGDGDQSRDTKAEGIKNLQFLPNQELFVVSTSRRLLLVSLNDGYLNFDSSGFGAGAESDAPSTPSDAPYTPSAKITGRGVRTLLQPDLDTPNQSPNHRVGGGSAESFSTPIRNPVKNTSTTRENIPGSTAVTPSVYTKTDLYMNSQWNQFINHGRNILLSSNLGKYNPLGFVQNRQLILTDTPSIIYVDASKLQAKGEIFWDLGNPPVATKVNSNSFAIYCPKKKRTYKFALKKDLTLSIDEWVNGINEVAYRHNPNNPHKSPIAASASSENLSLSSKNASSSSSLLPFASKRVLMITGFSCFSELDKVPSDYLALWSVAFQDAGMEGDKMNKNSMIVWKMVMEDPLAPVKTCDVFRFEWSDDMINAVISRMRNNNRI